MKSTYGGLFLLLILITGIGIYYNYPSMWHLIPQGSHVWRQADCMAMTQNYQQFHLPFMQPATYNLESLHGNVMGEFPVFYFIAAKFSNAALALRVMHTLLFLSGIIAFYFIAVYFLEDELISIFATVFLFTSPLLVFYGNNFLSDVPALSMALIGWAIYLSANKNNKLVWVFVAFLFFAFAALLKASEVINIEMVFVLYLSESYQTKKISIKKLLPFSFIFIPFFWYLHAKEYNLQNHDSYYFLSVIPIWKLSAHEIGLGIWRIVVSNSKNYFWRPTSVIMILSIYFLLKKWKKATVELRLLIASSFVFVMLYMLLFYRKMIGHEYYYVPFFVFVVFGMIGLFKIYRTYYAENVFSHAFLFLLLIANIIYCKHFLMQKLSDDYLNGNLSSMAMHDFLIKKGVTVNKTIVSVPDISPNQTLYQLQRKGYTEYNDYLAVLKNKEADYLVIGNQSLLNNEKLKPYLQDSIGSLNGVYIYKLR